MRDNIPTHNADAERAVLSCMMLDADAIILAGDNLKAADFYEARHRFLFSTLCALYKSGKTPDLLEIEDRLKADDKLRAVGGDDYLREVFGQKVQVSNVETYCRIVLEEADRRRAQRTAIALEQAAMRGAGSAELSAIFQAGAPTTKDNSETLKIKIGGPSELMAVFELERAGKRNTIPLPWPRLSDQSGMLRPGTFAVLGGPKGRGKSMMALQIAMHAHSLGVSWAYVPLEDHRVDVERRILAFLANTWAVIDTERFTAADREILLTQNGGMVSEIAEHVTENPRLPVMGADGKPTVPPLPFDVLLDIVQGLASKNRLVFIDPYAQIEFEGARPWENEKKFIRHLVGFAAHWDCTIILIVHTIKRPGKAGQIAITGEDIQGCAEINRLAHSIILLEAHEPKDSDVWRFGGSHESVTHERTVIIDAARNTPGRGMQFAFGLNGAHLEEIGTIMRKQKKETW